MKQLLILIVASTLLSSCYNSISIDNFEAREWKNDPHACKGARTSMIDTLFAHREELTGFKQQEIELFLGKPNRTDLDARMRKVFYYYYTPSAKCDSSISNTKALAVEFESLNRVRFVSKAEL